MCESISEKCDRFIAHNQQMIEVAVSERNLQNGAIHAKVLLCSIFDSLSKSAFANISNNSRRFKTTIDSYSNWEDRDRISLLHLVRAFDIYTNIPPEFEELREWSISLFRTEFPVSRRILSASPLINRDPHLLDIQNIWPRDNNDEFLSIGSIKPYQLQHKHMLWLYRNRLVHEYRSPGGGFNTMRLNESLPYYIEASTIQGYTEEQGLILSNHWELTYPVGFFLELCHHALLGIAEMHREANTSPFAAYSDGSYWIPDFNESGE
ncbi:hypothetical protein [Marinobacterium mangrovicola]|uniref:Uncharacterized protein n=1 Tax=Marinobacterium mangrovicola TaxID=1476959 RepID=A0A4R1GBD5_9GAMM|nr:hypothetical protein [Marinobacterium mangrovicola]TCK02969.1 hypothetical protein CLV83_4022 [Marinobacterium mangrovicola]